ncbi:hypothetical protein [Rhizobium sp. GN54]|uniref:hypothetical protein n=1 Tax=Rhizobium sp. GN54 TaxID=2898150 RepID=UPI001E5B575E|nr:hypothetical protein [Rhizobium sp. GN54]MCD2182505.1 hypothetical protein [Rhizobium sp. GN54]
MAISILGAAGIFVLPHSYHHASVAWHHVTALGGIELRVPASQAGDAQAILESIDLSQSRRNAWLRAATGILLLIWIGIPLPAGGLFARRAFPAAEQTVSR